MNRELIPGSPFDHVRIRRADASGSRLEGLTKEEPVVSEGKSKNSDQKQSGSKRRSRSRTGTLAVRNHRAASCYLRCVRQFHDSTE